jgi:hypothetical protein
MMLLSCVLIVVMLAALAAAIWYLHLVIIGLVAHYRPSGRPRYVLDLTGEPPWLRK